MARTAASSASRAFHPPVVCKRRLKVVCKRRLEMVRKRRPEMVCKRRLKTTYLVHEVENRDVSSVIAAMLPRSVDSDGEIQQRLHR